MNPEAEPVIPRRLAIQILHEAQIAQPESICGVVGALGDLPATFLRAGGEQMAASGQRLWARLWSNPTAPAVPTADQLSGGGLYLVVSLDTKGVLEMRAWELRGGAPYERVLKVQD